MATAQLIYGQIKLLNEVYQRGISEQSMQAMALVWEDDLQELSDQQFVAALSGHRKKSRYWPTPADILEAHSNTIPNRPPALALEITTSSPEEYRRNAVYAAIQVKALCGSSRARDFFSTNDLKERDSIATELLGNNYQPGELFRLCGAREVLQ